MAIQLLRNCRVAIKRGGVTYPFPALIDVSLSSSISQTTINRKTLFNKVARPIMVTGQINPTVISMNVLVTLGGNEGILLELLGLTKTPQGYIEEIEISKSPELFEVIVQNKDTKITATPCFMEAVDVSLAKASSLSFDCSISAANIQSENISNSIAATQSNPVTHTPIFYKEGVQVQQRIKSASISIQQVCDWVKGKTLFQGTEDYAYSNAILTDRTISANATLNHDGQQINTAKTADLELGQSGLKLTIENARITSNLNLSYVYEVRNDIYVTEDSGQVIITLEN